MPSKELQDRLETVKNSVGKPGPGGDFPSFLDPFGTLKLAERSASTIFHKATGTPSSKEKRNQQSLINEQIKAYKDQTELAAKELATLKDQKDMEKRKINEKQIRSLRGSYRAPGGFLNNQSLGNTNGLTNKLGA
jgi:hypothetical protein